MEIPFIIAFIISKVPRVADTVKCIKQKPHGWRFVHDGNTIDVPIALLVASSQTACKLQLEQCIKSWLPGVATYYIPKSMHAVIISCQVFITCAK